METIAVRLLWVLVCVACSSSAFPAFGQDAEPADPVTWVEYAGSKGLGSGKHIVLIAGDEEYRSEEALPQLARILSVRHGFRCTVLFSTNEKGEIDPNASGCIKGLEALEIADLMVLFTRFRRLPDADMKHIVDYVEAGKPLIGIRTATHAFAYEDGSESPYARWHWSNKEWPGGFGRQILGETWVNHHGHHGQESTAGVIPEAAKSHPILRGVEGVWGPTDVYGIRELPEDATVLLEGSVLAGMEPTSPPVEGAKNSPRIPIMWTRARSMDDGAKQRIVASTIGAAVDLESEGLRRAFVNSCYWAMGLEERIPERSDVDIVGEYEPTMFGFGKFRVGVLPADHSWPK